MRKSHVEINSSLPEDQWEAFGRLRFAHVGIIAYILGILERDAARHFLGPIRRSRLVGGGGPLLQGRPKNRRRGSSFAWRFPCWLASSWPFRVRGRTLLERLCFLGSIPGNLDAKSSASEQAVLGQLSVGEDSAGSS
jgi:hypothetical protein